MRQPAADGGSVAQLREPVASSIASGYNTRASVPAMSASNENDPPTLIIVRSPTQEPTIVASDLIDEPTLASRLGVSSSTLQNRRYMGRGPRSIKLGRMSRYRNADVDAYLRSNTRGKVA